MVTKFKQKITALLNSFDISTENLTDFGHFVESFTHSTYANEHRSRTSYDRNEFLGDAILQFKVSEYLFIHFPKMDEGHSTTLRSTLVNTNNLSNLSKKLNLFSLLEVSKGATNLDESKKVHADLFESLVAAIYLSFSLEAVEKLLKNTIYPEVDKFVNKENKDAKTLFQELIQAKDLVVIYETTKVDDKFISTVIYNKTKYGTGYGKNKKEAEENAARNALESLNA